MRALKRILCFFGLHWNITTERFGMGDGRSCDICGRETYGWLLHVRSRTLSELQEVEGWRRNERIIAEWSEDQRTRISSFPDRSEIADLLDTHPTIKCRWGDKCNFDYDLWLPKPPRPAIWRKDMRYPECRFCFVEDPYE
jgi:hypothetical protein